MQLLRHNCLVSATCITVIIMLSMQRAAAFTVRHAARTQARTITATSVRLAEEGQAEVVLVGCGAPNRGASL